MSNPANVSFYGHHKVGIHRMIYRRLAVALRQDPAKRAEALAGALRELSGTDDEFRKFKFLLPDFLREEMTPQEIETFMAATAPRRALSDRLRMVLPRVSDEFSLQPEFLNAVLDLTDGPSVPDAGRFFTIGSCFARNITQFLVASGRQAETYELAEDLNSPISNAFLLDILRRPDAERREILAHWLRRLFPGITDVDVEGVTSMKLASIDDLGARLARADCVVMTLGNVVDFFRDDTADTQPLMEKVFPKFIALAAENDLGPNANAASRLKKQGASLRLASHQETREAIAACVAGIRSVTVAPIVITLSPVPVDSVLGLSGTLKSAIEVDCVSKARLRSALDEVTPELRAVHGPIHYYPSFEIVRWIAPMLHIPSFGLEDAATRHVSTPILAAVCSLFLDRFVKWSGAEPPRDKAADVFVFSAS